MRVSLDVSYNAERHREREFFTIRTTDFASRCAIRIDLGLARRRRIGSGTKSPDLIDEGISHGRLLRALL